MAELSDIIEERRKRGLPPGDRGGNGGGMPPELPERVATLEAHVEHIREDLTALRAEFGTTRADVGTLKTDVATMKENIRHLPTTGKTVGMLAVVLALITGIVGLAPKIQSFFGTAPPITNSAKP